MAQRVTIETVLMRPSHYKGIKPREMERFGALQYHIASDAFDIPRLQFTFYREHQIYLPERLVPQAKQAGYEPRKTEKDYTFLVSEMQPSVLWLCNFKRSGWGWTFESDGKTGYKELSYAKLPIPALATTPELVVTHTLIKTWDMLLDRRFVPEFFNAAVTSELLQRLLLDALVNIKPELARPYLPQLTYSHGFQVFI